MNAHTPPPAPIVFPEKLQCLFIEGKRYLVLYGGRGGGRSWNVGRKLLLEGASRTITVLCARELQKSVGESVHRVLKLQIEKLGLLDFYDVQRDYIYGLNGTTFSFVGVKNDPNKIRSFEDIDYCWVEEANKVSEESWTILTPTIRKKGSKIIITFNPELKKDYTYKNFVLDLMPKAHPVYCSDPTSPLFEQILWYETDDTVICKMTYEDNPWFFEDTELPSDMLKVKNDPEKEDEYLNIWLGFPKENLTGAVYAKELRRAQKEGRVCSVPWDRETPVDTAWDLGKHDKTCVWFFQRVAMKWLILDYLEGSMQELSFYIKELQRREYIYGTHFLPHDAKAKKLGMRHTIQEQLARAYPKQVQIVPVARRSDGINAAREVFPQCWFDEAKTEVGLQGLKDYRYKIVDGQLSKDPLHDLASDTADGFRTFAMARRLPREGDAEVILERLRRPARPLADALANSLNWLSS